MYLEHFGLREPPFRITPHTEFFFAGAKRGATLDALIYAITHDEGIVKVTGEVGSGKTMLCRVLLERLPPHVVTIYLATPSLTREDILYAIADELALELPEPARAAQILRRLQDRLIELYGEGKQVVVLIDEAHVMPLETLEEIRLLSNLESNRHKLLQIVLFGQPELNDILAQTNMRQLKERITHNFGLEPLVREHIAEYINFRLRAAGYKGPNLFSPAAIKAIAEASQGLTRRINILADKSMLAAFATGSHDIGRDAANTAICDSEFSGLGSRHLRPLLAAGLIAGVVIAAVMAGRYSSTPAPAPEAAAAPAPAAAAAPVASTAPAAATAATPTPATPDMAHPLLKPETEPDMPGLGPLTQERLRAGKDWLARSSNERWFIQLLATDGQGAGNVERYLQRLAKQLPVEHTHVYLVSRGNARKLGVIYGDFSSQTAAQKFIESLPPELKNSKPYPRPIKHLR